MHGFFGFAFSLVLVGLAIAAGLVYALVRLFSGSGQSGGGGLKEDEARLMQELYQGLSRMEERVESLETILMDKESGRRPKDDIS